MMMMIITWKMDVGYQIKFITYFEFEGSSLSL